MKTKLQGTGKVARKVTKQRFVAIHPVLAAHMRWMFVLAKLQSLVELESTDEGFGPTDKGAAPPKKLKEAAARATALEEAAEAIGAAELFRSGQALLNPSLWNRWFTAGRGARSEVNEGVNSPLETIYQCRAFYGLEAPNNAAQRFLAMVPDAAEHRLRASKKESKSKYDRNILAWGRYAETLVEHNGGWEAFLARRPGEEVRDVWPGAVPPGDADASFRNPDSFAQRALALSRDRYVQILAAPVGLHWPVWFLRRRENLELLHKLRGIEGGTFSIGPILDERDGLYIDVNTAVGSMRGLPYPIGYADDVFFCEEQKGKGLVPIEGGNDRYKSLQGDTSWSAGAVMLLAGQLRKEYWSPPLLFAGRGELFQPPDDRRENSPIGFVQVSQASRIFASAHRRVGREFHSIKGLNLRYPKGSWAAEVLRGLKVPEEALDRMERTVPEMLTDYAEDEPDLILSFFPVDLLVQIDSNYRQMSSTDIITSFRPEEAKEILYTTGNSVLAGCRYLSRQPKMEVLLEDVALHLTKAQFLAMHLAPRDPKVLRGAFDAMKSNDRKTRVQAAAQIDMACTAAGSRTEAVTEKIAQVDTLKQAMIEIGRAMIDAVATSPARERHRAESIELAHKEMEEWGWARLLEYVGDTSVYLSAMAFTK